MRDNFIRCAAVSPDVTVADPLANELSIKAYMDEAAKNNVSVLVFPELCLTGYTCNDLFLQDTLLKNSLDAVIRLAEYTKDKNFIAFVGLPFMYGNCLYNVAAALCNGRIIGLIPKKNLPSYSEFYETRHFTPGFDECVNITVGDCSVPFGSKLLFACKDIPSLVMPCSLVRPAALLSTRRTLAAHPRPQRTFEFLGAERRQEPLPRDRESPCRSHIHEKCQNFAGCNTRGT